MKKVNQYINKNCEKQSSNGVIYQGPEITCIDYCDNEDIGSLFHKLTLVFCPIKEQFDNLVNITYGCATPVSNPTLVNLFNSLYERDCELQNQIGNILAAEPAGLELDWCSPIPYICTQTCLFDLPACCADQTKSIPEILQQLTGRTIFNSIEICDLQQQINNIFIPDPTSPYQPPQILLSCAQGYWDGFSYVPAPLTTIPMEVSIPILDKDLCKVKSMLGSVTEFNSMLSNDCLGSDGSPVHEYNATTVIGVIKEMQDYMCLMQQQLTSVALIQDECCRTECEECMDTSFKGVNNNYGTAYAGNIAAVINLTASINTQVLQTCVGNDLNQNTSFFWLTDGFTTKVIYLADIPTTSGVTINSGSIGNTSTFNISFDLDLLGLDYTRNITIKLKIKTTAVNPCEDETRVLIPAYQNPNVCDICKVCINDFNNNGATGTIVFNVMSNLHPTVQYVLTSDNPCINLEREENEVLSIQIVSNTSRENLRLESDCPELGVSAFCDDDTDPCSIVNLTSVQAGSNANITWAASGATSFEIQWRTSANLVWQSATSATNSYTLPITECVSYEVRVRALCNPAGEWSYITFMYGDCTEPPLTDQCYKVNIYAALTSMNQSSSIDLSESFQCIMTWTLGTANFVVSAMANIAPYTIDDRLVDNINQQNFPCTTAVINTNIADMYITTPYGPPIVTFTFLQAVGGNYYVTQQTGIAVVDPNCPVCP